MIYVKYLRLSGSMAVVDFFVLVFVILHFFACGKPSANNTIPQNDTTSSQPYALVWQDEFNGTTLDTLKWNYEVNGSGGGNNELQYYTNSLNNCYVKGGSLVIKAIKKITKVNYILRLVSTPAIRVIGSMENLKSVQNCL